MKTLTALCTIIATALFLSACGVEEGDDGNTVTPPTETPDAGTTPDTGTTPEPTYLPAPLKSPAADVLQFSTAYISGSPCGELVGDLPGITWDKGVRVEDKDATTGELDGYLSTAYPAPAGTYHVSYIDRECPGEVRQTTGWAQYGDKKTQLPNMKAEDRAYVNCTWYDAAAKACVSVSNPGCNLAFAMDADGNVTPAGNMRDFNLESDKDCNK